MKNISKGIVGVAGCLAVGFATWVTKDANCLWALLLVVWIVDVA